MNNDLLSKHIDEESFLIFAMDETVRMLPSKKREIFQQHLNECAECRAKYKAAGLELENMRRGYVGVDVKLPDEFAYLHDKGFAKKILQRLDSEEISTEKDEKRSSALATGRGWSFRYELVVPVLLLIGFGIGAAFLLLSQNGNQGSAVPSSIIRINNSPGAQIGVNSSNQNTKGNFSSPQPSKEELTEENQNVNQPPRENNEPQRRQEELRTLNKKDKRQNEQPPKLKKQENEPQQVVSIDKINKIYIEKTEVSSNSALSAKFRSEGIAALNQSDKFQNANQRDDAQAYLSFKSEFRGGGGYIRPVLKNKANKIIWVGPFINVPTTGSAEENERNLLKIIRSVIKDLEQEKDKQ